MRRARFEILIANVISLTLIVAGVMSSGAMGQNPVTTYNPLAPLPLPAELPDVATSTAATTSVSSVAERGATTVGASAAWKLKSVDDVRDEQVRPASGQGPLDDFVPAGSGLAEGDTAANSPATRGIARVSSGTGTLPNDDGQVWREYDITGFTDRIQGERSEQAIVDWILRETGTEAWFADPVGLLSANRQVLRVYHTPQMQQVVANIVDRFVRKEASTYAFGVRLCTVSSPNWRTKAFSRLRAVPVQTPGVEAWLLSKEDAAIVLADLRKRTDYREHNTPNLLIYNGHSQELSHKSPMAYVRSVNPQGAGWPTQNLEMGQVEVGYRMALSPLLSLDERTIDAVIKVESSQVEQLTPVAIPVPTMANPNQQVQIQVPQTSSWRLHERFRWPADQVLLVSCGVVASPSPEGGRRGALGVGVNRDAPRADALLFLEGKGGVPSRNLPGRNWRPRRV
ncbi:MAG: hypothetical protein R3E01_04700 [Pirellulaceae bacterium]